MCRDRDPGGPLDPTRRLQTFTFVVPNDLDREDLEPENSAVRKECQRHTCDDSVHPFKIENHAHPAFLQLR